jgi:signal transduction histidine kinase
MKPSHSAALAPARRPRLLIAEDESLIAEELEVRMGRMGLEVVGIVSSAEEAIDVAARELPDLVLMDVRLKGAMDGIEAASIIRKLSVPVVFLTAHSDEATIGRAKLADPFGYVLKPFNERDLRVAIEMALHKHKVEAALREAEEKLRQAQRMESVGRLAGGVAQEINNMMTIVIGYADLLLRARVLDEEQQGMLEEIRCAGNHSAAMVRQLLAFAQRQILQPVPVDLNRLALGMRPQIAALIGSDIDLKYALDPELGSVAVDESQFEAVVLNLCQNARDAMPDGGVLTITSSNLMVEEHDSLAEQGVASGAHVRLSVSDTGHGMDPETRARVFEPFFTSPNTWEGPGLRLAMAYGIVKQSGGQLNVESEVGLGSTFTITLPQLRT